METNKLYEVALGMIPGIGGGLTKLLVSYCGSPERIFNTPKGKLKKIPGIGEKLAETIISNKHTLIEAEKVVEKALKEHTQIFFYTDKDYPERLKNINDAPAILYYKGNVGLNPPKTVGIVGTRNASEYGKITVDRIIEAIKIHEPLIISGLAYGIDIAAHQAALNQGLSTIGCMATGLDKIYPSVHSNIAHKMINQGGLLTEYPFEKKANPDQFPARNRIIAALCDVLIVVEAAAKGGALITAEMANDYNREVFAIPGNIDQKYSEGCNKLISNHQAHIFTDVHALEKVMNWTLDSQNCSVNTRPKALVLDGLETDEISIYQLLSSQDTLLIDELSWKSNIPISKLASVLLSMEFKGVLKSLPGKRYKLA
jgi:DNA processing protein